MEDCKIHKNQIYVTLFLCIVPIIICAITSIELTKAMSSEFFMSPYLLLLPILIIVLSVVGVKSTYCMWAGIIGGGIVSIIYKRTGILKVLNETLVTGVSCVEYAPFAILCFIAPMITTLFAFNNKN